MAASITASSQDLPLGRRTPAHEPLAFRIMAWSVFLVAVGVLASGLLRDPGLLSNQPAILVAWTALVSLAGLISVSLAPGMELAVDLPLLLAAAYLWGPIVGGLVSLIGSSDRREFRREVTLTSAVFNHAQVSLSVLAAGYVFSWAGGPHDGWPLLLLPAFLGLVADVAVNTTLVVLITPFKRGEKWIDVLRSMKFGSPALFSLTYLGFGGLAVVLVNTYREAGAWALAEFAVPFLLARQTFRQGTELDERARELRRRQKALESLSLQIAEERQDERARIASALHDEVQQALYNVTLHTEVIREEMRSGRLLALEDDIPRLLQASQRTRSLLREVIRGLRKSNLGVGGLSQTLRLLVDDLSSSWTGRLEAHIEEVGGPPEIQLLVYQIAREAVRNAIRHSKASLIQVRLFREGNEIGLFVADDGCGFDPNAVDADRHFGLQIMLERAKLAGGNVKVVSRLGMGTQIAGSFPASKGATT